MGSQPAAGLTARERARTQKEEILDDWAGGMPIAAIARTYSVPRHIISSLLEDEGVRGDRPDPRSIARERQREDVLRFIRENPGVSVDSLVKRTGIHHRTLVGYIAGTPERKLIVEQRTKSRSYTDQEMEEHIRKVWNSLGPDERGRDNGLSRKRFTALAGDDAPSTALYDRRYPSWTAACEAAGVPPGKTFRRSYQKTYEDSVILDSIAEYIEETGITSYNGYTSWAAGRDRPSGGLVILRYGTWNAARIALLDRGA